MHPARAILVLSLSQCYNCCVFEGFTTGNDPSIHVRFLWNQNQLDSWLSNFQKIGCPYWYTFQLPPCNCVDICSTFTSGNQLGRSSLCQLAFGIWAAGRLLLCRPRASNSPTGIRMHKPHASNFTRSTALCQFWRKMGLSAHSDTLFGYLAC